jgi:hypothetical protein
MLLSNQQKLLYKHNVAFGFTVCSGGIGVNFTPEPARACKSEH